MDYLLTEEQKMIQGLAREIAEEKIKPKRAYMMKQKNFHGTL